MKKLLSILLITCLLFVSGCKKKPAPGDPGSPQASAFRNPLQIWMSGSKDEEQFLEAMAKQFVSLGGKEFQGLAFKIINFSTDEALQERSIDKMAEGGGPDIVYTNGEWIFNNSNKLMAIANDPGLTAEQFNDSFVRAASQTLTVEKDSTTMILGVPLSVDTMALYYNSEHILDRLPDRNIPGKTWEEFQQDVVNLTKADTSVERFAVSGTALGRGDNIHYSYDVVENIMFQQGVQFITYDKSQYTFHNTQGKGVLGRQGNLGVDAMNFFTSFSDPRYKHYSWSDLMANQTNPALNFETFVSGRVSMIFGYHRDKNKIMQAMDFYKSRGGKAIDADMIKTTYFPQPKSTLGFGSRKLLARVHALGVSKNSKLAKVSWRFLKFLSWKENQESYHNQTGNPTAMVELLAEHQQNPDMQVFATQSKFAVTNIIPHRKSILRRKMAEIITLINQGKGAAGPLLKSLADELNIELRDRSTMEVQTLRR